MRRPKPPAYIAAHIRRVLKDGGSAPLRDDVQCFFKEQVASYGWRTADLRRLAARFRRVLLTEGGQDYLLAVADKLFTGRVLEEKAMAVELLARSVKHFGDAEFKLFESWLARVRNWADHDALVMYLIGPMLAAQPRRAARVFRWARSRNRWHRRAAAVALIRGVRRDLFFSAVKRVSELLLRDPDDMVQKGLGWLLREAAKAQRTRTVPYLMRIRGRAPRLVLRTACETLPATVRKQVLAS
jgi:3-methyladenine DNA glycosylase AlkD